ncbi:DUF7344 domain-containing protein [Halovivax cerinus]|uniref:DUF7344 domain-containing protein n=1 Tax=Halovivax cerinus TaxID=1487865 RepID=A0ABD5NJ48_9EURY|nr:hypothetical protein [Halovivax cerinus]
MSQSRNRAADETVRTIELPPSDRHDLLASERRRLTIDVLEECQRTVDLEDIAAAVAARTGTDAESSAEDATRIAIELHHVHLPKLADAGVIEYDPSIRLVTLPADSIAATRSDE